MDFSSSGAAIVDVRPNETVLQRLKRGQGERTMLCKPDELHLHFNTQFYKYPPLINIPLTYFEEFAEARLRLLQDIESCRERAGKDKTQFAEKLDALLCDAKSNNHRIARSTCRGPSALHTSNKPDELEQRRRDHVSHFILRLVLCKSAEQQKWMVKQEVELFKHRWAKESHEYRELFLHVHGLSFDRVTDQEIDALHDQIGDSTPALGGSSAEKHTFWKVPILQALEVYRRRRCFVRARLCYVHDKDMVSIVAAKFHDNLAHGLRLASKHYAVIQEEELIQPCIKRLSAKTYMGDDYAGAQTNVVTPNMIQKLSVESFPLCMRSLQESLKHDHHLKYGGRQQYGLFLKGIGVSLEGAMTFFRQHFTQILDGDKFDKQYGYNIRHQYGKEGKRANYTPMNCTAIQTRNPPSASDCHGCPFRHWDANVLKKRLNDYNVPDKRASAILDAARQGQFDRACTRYFEATHNMADTALQSTQGLVSHPNKYYEWSREYRGGRQGVLDDKGLAAFTNSQHSSVAYGGASQSTPTNNAAPPQSTPTSNAAPPKIPANLNMTAEDLEDLLGEDM